MRGILPHAMRTFLQPPGLYSFFIIIINENPDKFPFISINFEVLKLTTGQLSNAQTFEMIGLRVIWTRDFLRTSYLKLLYHAYVSTPGFTPINTTRSYLTTTMEYKVKDSNQALIFQLA